MIITQLMVNMIYSLETLHLLLDLPVQPSKLILPSPVVPGGQRQTNPSIEFIQEADSTQSAVVEHSSGIQPPPLMVPFPVVPGGHKQMKRTPSLESIQVASSTQSASPLVQAAACAIKKSLKPCQAQHIQWVTTLFYISNTFTLSMLSTGFKKGILTVHNTMILYVKCLAQRHNNYCPVVSSPVCSWYEGNLPKLLYSR